MAEARTDPKRTPARPTLVRRPRSGFVASSGPRCERANAGPVRLSRSNHDSVPGRRGKPQGNDPAESKRHDLGRCPKSLGGIVAPPGFLKSPVIQACTRLLL